MRVVSDIILYIAIGIYFNRFVLYCVDHTNPLPTLEKFLAKKTGAWDFERNIASFIKIDQ